MGMVILTALGVGTASVIGALLGFVFKNPSRQFSNLVTSFAAGVMLSTAVVSLILPSLEYGKHFAVSVMISGVFCGAFCLNLLDRLVPHLHHLVGIDKEEHAKKTEQINRVLLFVMAIAIHNLPEGIAAGVGFGTGDMAQAFSVAGGIALQNIPEGMVIIAPMLAAGISHRRTLLCAAVSGMIEVVGTLLGYFAVSLSEAILPFVLAFAGGTMLYVVSDEMIPETHADGRERGATYALVAGFCLMPAIGYYLG